MSWVQYKTNSNYEEALKATDSLGEPRGFTLTQETKDMPIKASIALAAQNNTQIYLLLKILDKVEDLETRLLHLEKAGGEQSNPEIKAALTDVSQKFKGLQYGKEAPPQVVRQVYFLQDPKKILEEELKKNRN